MRRALFLKITIQAMYFGFLAFLFLGVWILACFWWDKNPYPWFIILLAVCGAWNIALAFLLSGLNADAELGMVLAQQKGVPVPKIARHGSQARR